MKLASEYSFRFVNVKKIQKDLPEVNFALGENLDSDSVKAENFIDENKRTFLKLAGLVGLGVAVSSAIPKKAEALVMGGTPATSVVGIKDGSNNRIDPAVKTGNLILKKSVALTSSGIIHTPNSGNKLRIYNAKFSLSSDMDSVAFRFTSSGENFEYYFSPKSGGLYGSNNHPNYIEGGIDESLYAIINGTGTVQVNMDYLEV